MVLASAVSQPLPHLLPQGDLKKQTVASMEDYVHRDERLPMLLDRLKENGMKTFLLTNSEFWYTEAIMNFLLNFDGVSWEPWT